MKIPEKFITFLTNLDVALWAANCDIQRVPDLVRPTGVVKGDSDDELTIYVPRKNADKFLRNFKENDQLALFTSRITTFESYQFKGRYTGQRPANDEEVESQKRLIEALGSFFMQIFGFPGEWIKNAYYSVPIVALSFRVEQIFEQTPKKGTGAQISKVE